MGCPVTGDITSLKLLVCMHRSQLRLKVAQRGSLKSAKGSSCQAVFYKIVKWCGGVSTGSVGKQRHLSPDLLVSSLQKDQNQLKKMNNLSMFNITVKV